MVNRSQLMQALSKSLAYLAVGKDTEATDWAHRLIELLRDAGVKGLRH